MNNGALAINRAHKMKNTLNELVTSPVSIAQSKDIQELISHLEAYNHTQTGANDKIPITTIIRQPDGALAGGLFAFISYGWCVVELLWVDEQYRGNDLATNMMNHVEQYALNKGITRFKLETGSFQALDFYKKLGYEVYAQLEDYPIGHTNYYCRKLL